MQHWLVSFSRRIDRRKHRQMPCVEFYLVKLPSDRQKFKSDASCPTLKDMYSPKLDVHLYTLWFSEFVNDHTHILGAKIEKSEIYLLLHYFSIFSLLLAIVYYAQLNNHNLWLIFQIRWDNQKKVFEYYFTSLKYIS